MRKAFYPLLFLLYVSCKKETEEVIVITPAPSPLSLTIDQVINDSTIVLKWTPYPATFKKYYLSRTAIYLKDGRFDTFTETIDSSTDVNHLRFTESAMPLARDISYDLFVKDDAPQYKIVGHVTYRRPNSLFYGSPTDVLIDKQNKRLYITEETRITIVSYTSGRVILSKDLPVSIGYCSLGVYNGNSELYVPSADGWVEILDAATLDFKDKIYAGGFYIGSVINSNGKLYISSSDMSIGYTDCLKVFDRATKAFIGRSGYWPNTRLLQLDGSSVEMIDITINLIPTNLSYYQFSADGVPTTKKDDTYHGDYRLDPRIARSFPDGSKIITSSSGTIFNKSLVFDRYLKEYGGYTDFAFNDDGSLVYAADGSAKKIDVVTYPSTTTTGSYTTGFYPYKIFRDGNVMICVSRALDAQQQQYTYLLIEKVNL